MSPPGLHTPRTSWRTLLGDYPNTRALRSGAVTSPRVTLAFDEIAVPNQAFTRVVRDVAFDVAELALMTFLMARSRGVPLRLLPVVVFSRNPLPYLVCNLARRRLGPADLAGRRIGVRSYTTTTAAWLRAVLADLYGVDFSRVDWITIEEGHVAGVPDPSTVRRARAGTNLASMLLDGAIDAVIVDPVPVDPRFTPVVRDPEGAYDEWQQRWDALTVNHVVVVREALSRDADAMAELFRLFRESREMAGPEHDPSTTPIGFEANRRNLEVALAAASAQGLLARPLAVEDLVTGVLAALA